MKYAPKSVKNWYSVDLDTKILVKIFEFNIMNDSYSGLGYHQQKTKL